MRIRVARAQILYVLILCCHIIVISSFIGIHRVSSRDSTCWVVGNVCPWWSIILGYHWWLLCSSRILIIVFICIFFNLYCLHKLIILNRRGLNRTICPCFAGQASILVNILMSILLHSDIREIISCWISWLSLLVRTESIFYVVIIALVVDVGWHVAQSKRIVGLLRVHSLTSHIVVCILICLHSCLLWGQTSSIVLTFGFIRRPTKFHSIRIRLNFWVCVIKWLYFHHFLFWVFILKSAFQKL